MNGGQTYLQPPKSPGRVADKGSRDLLQLLANPTNRRILSVLSLEPQYPRRLADLVGLTEDEASRRLRLFEKVGLAEGAWAHVGKNVRLYKLSTNRFTVTVEAGSLSVAGLQGPAPVALGSTAEMPPRFERFVGREEELRQVEEVLAQRRAALIVGIGGAGKTAFAAAYAARAGRPLHWHTVAPGESPTLFLGRLAASQRALDPGERGERLIGLRDAEDENLLLQALVDSFNAVGSLVVIDRFDAAGEGAADVLAHLARGLTNARLLLTARAFPKGLPRDLVASYRLPGLTRQDAERVLSSFGARVAGDQLQEIYDRTRGHALSLVLVAQVADDRREARVERLMEESGIRDFLLGDVVPQLPEHERDVLYAASVFRTPLTTEEAEEVAQSRHAGQALVQLEVRGLVSRAGDVWMLHDLVRSFVAEAAPQKRVLHGRAAKLLKKSGEPAKVLEALHHYLEAGAVTEAGMVVRDEVASRTYRFFDSGLGPRYGEVLERLVAADRSESPGRAAALVELGIQHTLVGDPTRAGERLEAAARAVGRSLELGVPLLLARARLRRLQGDAEGASRLLEEAHDAAARAKNRNLQLEALVDRAFLEEERDDRRGFELFRRAIDLAHESSDIRMLSLAYSGAARIGMRQGLDTHKHWAEEALRLARIAGYLRGEVSVYMTLTTHALMRGELQSSLELSDRYLKVAGQLGDPWLRACALGDRAMLLIVTKRFDEALAMAQQTLQLAQEIHSPFYEYASRILAGEALLALDRPEEAIQALEPALHLKVEAWPAMGARGWRSYAMILRALGRGRDAERADARAREWAQRSAPGDNTVEWARFPQAAASPETPKPPARSRAARRGRTP